MKSMLPCAGVAFWKHFPEQDQDGKSLAKAVLEFQRRFNMDLIKITPASTWQVQDYGFESHWDGNLAGKRSLVNQGIEQLEKLSVFSTIGAQLEQSRIALQEVKWASSGKQPILFTLFSPSTQLLQLVGFPAFEYLYQTKPDVLNKALTILLENTQQAIVALSDADGLFYAIGQSGWLSQQPGGFEELFYRYDFPPVSNLPAQTSVIHLHGSDLPGFLWKAIPSNRTIHYERTWNVPIEANHWPGLSTSQLLEGECEIIPSFITAGCTLPLNFPDTTIDLWKNKVS